jgi:hypothetical protein
MDCSKASFCIPLPATDDCNFFAKYLFIFKIEVWQLQI